MKRISGFLLLFTILFVAPSKAQTVLTKDAMNSFAKFSSSKDIKDLELARKQIDDAYKTKSDSNSFKNNLIRALVYASLARNDSNLNLKYTKDPVEEVQRALKQVYSSKSVRDAESELRFINDQLRYTYIYRANTRFKDRQFTQALKYFSILDTLEKGDLKITHNLAMLHQELGNYSQSATFYETLIARKPKPEYFLILSTLYEYLGNDNANLTILKKGSEAYPENRDLVFKLINILVNRNDYVEIARFSEQGLKLDESNVYLTYLAGFSNEMTGNNVKAEEYYKAVLEINPNNYEGNYALGLLYLNMYLKDRSKDNLMYASKFYLSKANEIDPNELKSLTSLSILYKYTGDNGELQRINNRINQLKLN